MGGKLQGAAEREKEQQVASSSVRREVDVGEIGQEEVETAMHKMKAAGADEVRLEMLEMAGEVGVKCTGRLLNVCMQEGRVPKEWGMGIILAWCRYGRGNMICMMQESTGASHYSAKY